ncbi:ABC transporter ATP-binding protein [Microbacterium sp. CPCC 204701]|uniref:ABC transporter ATP-binding protein n=1 Tax=Microbacterium sp. CPCC 204701 TaxID=2493084 RepID=UPI000FDC2053|nr:ABC transporter ATP-binding protein [Microbacterium sp. CPCC 204701]
MMLEIQGLSVAYGPTLAVKSVDLEVPRGTIVSVIGHNGAGKSSTLRAVAGLVKPSAGDIRFDGAPLKGVPAHRRPELGLVLVPEGRQLVPQLSVQETLTAAVGSSNASRSERAGLLSREYDRFPILGERHKQQAGQLSGGEAQMLALSRALIKNPTLIMLDEPSLGLAPQVVARLASEFRRLRDEGMTVLLVEQQPELAISVADTVVVIERGEVTRRVDGDDARRLGVVELLAPQGGAAHRSTSPENPAEPHTKKDR